MGLLRKTFRESDIVGRIGGDEFVILSMRTSLAKADVARSRLENNFQDFNRHKQIKATLSFSIGVAAYNPETPCTLTALLTQADSLMYEHKRRKKQTEEVG